MGLSLVHAAVLFIRPGPPSKQAASHLGPEALTLAGGVRIHCAERSQRETATVAGAAVSRENLAVARETGALITPAS